MSNSRQKVLRLYRQILRLGKTWEAKNPSDTGIERQYIVTEARTVFKSHINIQDNEAISNYIREAESRIDLGTKIFFLAFIIGNFLNCRTTNNASKAVTLVNSYFSSCSAMHYGTPYPRPMNLPPHSLAKMKGKEQGRFQERIKRQSTPIYIKSQFD